MQKIIKLLFLLLISVRSFGEFNSISHRIERIPTDAFLNVNLFSSKYNSKSYETLARYVSSYDLLEADQELLKSISNSDQALQIKIPIDGDWQTFLLIKNDALDKCIFTTQNAEGLFPASYKPGSYYIGHRKDYPQQTIAISFFQDEIIGLILKPEGNYVIGKSNMHQPIANEFIVYNDQNMLVKDIKGCDLDNSLQPNPEGPLNLNSTIESYTTNCVRFYWEADYETYTDFGSNITSTNNFISGLYNLVATLYLNDSIVTALSQVNVWTSTDPYVGGSTTYDMLTAFSTQMSNTTYSGDLAHLLSTRSAGGGIAWLNVLCSSNYYKSSVSASLSTTLTPLPTFSWNTEVVTHEIGHNMASPHTHACVWNGNNTRIDNCGGNAGYTEGNCASSPPNPVGGGTIMSYCHLQGVGINLSLGFGPQPGTLIRNTINNAACLNPCVECDGAIIITGTYSTPLTESSTYISATGQTTISPTTSVKLDADPGQGYVLMQPQSNNDYFVSNPSTNAGVFVAQAYNGCTNGAPLKPLYTIDEAENTSNETNLFRIYPNPVEQTINLVNYNFNNKKISYTLQGTDGRYIVPNTEIIFDSKKEINLPALSNGIYFLKIVFDGQTQIIPLQKTN